MSLFFAHNYFPWLAEALLPGTVVRILLRYRPVIQRDLLRSKSQLGHKTAAQSQFERRPRQFIPSLSQVVHELGTADLIVDYGQYYDTAMRQNYDL